MAKHLNIAALRAQSVAAAPVVTAPDGREFPVGALSLDAYLGILDLEENFEALRAKEKEQGAPDRATQRALFVALCDMVTAVLPGFPAGQLQMEELFQVLAFVQSANTPEATGEAETTPVGESTGRS
jgi:hypothetical protein